MQQGERAAVARSEQPDPVARADTVGAQGRGHLAGHPVQLAVIQPALTVGERGTVGVSLRLPVQQMAERRIGQGSHGRAAPAT